MLAASFTPPSLEVLYETCLDDVWRFLARLGVESSALEDAVQDTFIIAHRRLKSFRAEASPRTWLLGIALRVARDHRRRHDRKGGLTVLDETAPGEHQPDVTAMHREALAQVRAMLELLPEEQRETLVLIDLEGCSAREVGEMLGVPSNTVSSRLRLARVRFNNLARERGLP